MIANYFKDKWEWVRVFYGDYQKEVNLFGVFFLVVVCSFSIGYLSAGEFNRAKIVIEACNLLDGEVGGKSDLRSVEQASVLQSFTSADKGVDAGVSVVVDEIVVRDASAVGIGKKVATEVNWCDFNAGINTSINSVIFNEVAWMGSSSDSADEWMEIKNVVPVNVDLTGWQLQDRAGQIKVDFSGLSLKPREILVLARQADRLSLWADIAYSGTLSNSDEEIRLFNKGCEVVDSVKAASSWPAGTTCSRTSKRVTIS